MADESGEFLEKIVVDYSDFDAAEQRIKQFSVSVRKELDNLNKAQNQQKAQSQFTATIKTFDQEQKAIRALVQEFGSFNVQLDRTKAATSQAEVEFRKLLASSPALAKEIDNLANKFGNVASVEVSRANLLPSVKGTESNLSGIVDLLNQLGIAGASNLGAIALKFGAVGVAGLGFIKVLNTVKDAFADMARFAIQQLENIVTQSLETAKGIESTKLSLETLFGGDTAIADAVFQRTRDLSEQLGVDLTEIARNILPDLTSVDQLEDIAKLIQGLLIRNPKETVKGAIFSLQELLSGDLRSLQLRFRIDADSIRQAQDEFGNVEGGIIGLREELERLGIDFERIFDTLPALIGRAEQSFETFKGIAGTPILEALKEELTELLAFLDENKDNFQLFAKGFGEGVANIIQALGGIGEDVLSNLVIDPDKAKELAISLGQLGDALGFLAESVGNAVFGEIDIKPLELLTEIIDKISDKVADIGELIQLFDALGETLSSFSDYVGVIDILKAITTSPIDIALPEEPLLAVENLKTAVTAAIQLIGLLHGAVAAVVAIETEWLSSIDDIVRGNLSLGDAIENARNAGREAAGDVLADVSAEIDAINSSLNQYQENLSETSDEIDEFADNMRDANDEIVDQGSAMLAASNALAEAQSNLQAANDALSEAQADAQEDLKEASIDATNKRLDAERDYMRRVMDIERETSQARVDAIRKNQQEIQDIYRENAQEIQDIYRENAQEVADANRDLLRDVQDIFRKNSRKLSEIDEESADERIKIEEDFQRRIEEIRRKFEFDAEEAIRANDAIAYLRIQRRAQFEIDEADRRRTEELEDEATSSEEKRERAQEDLQREIEDAQIAHQRKLEDLQIALARDLEERRIALARRLEEANIALARELEQIQIAEQRKREEAKIQLDRQIEDIKIAYDRKRAEIQRSLQDEIKAVNAAQQAMAAAERQKVQILQASTNQIVALYAKQAKAAQSVVGINRNRKPSGDGTGSGDDNFGGGQTPPSKGYKPPIYVNPSPPDDGGGNNRGLNVVAPQTLQSVLSTAPQVVQTSVTNPPQLFSPPAPQTITRNITNSRSAEVPVTIYANDIFSPNQLRMLRTEIDDAIAEANRQ